MLLIPRFERVLTLRIVSTEALALAGRGSLLWPSWLPMVLTVFWLAFPRESKMLSWFSRGACLSLVSSLMSLVTSPL